MGTRLGRSSCRLGPRRPCCHTLRFILTAAPLSVSNSGRIIAVYSFPDLWMQDVPRPSSQSPQASSEAGSSFIEFASLLASLPWICRHSIFPIKFHHIASILNSCCWPGTSSRVSKSANQLPFCAHLLDGKMMSSFCLLHFSASTERQ